MERMLPRRRRKMQEMLPRLRFRFAVPEFLPAEGKKRATVGLLTGWIHDVVLRHVNWATAEVLQMNGCDVWTPGAQGCCGALHLHAGREDDAIRFAQSLCDVMLSRPDVHAFVVDVAGCGSTLKDYAHLLAHTPYADKAKLFQSKVKDVNEFLMELGPIKPTHPLPLRATYHDACHLCHAQKIRQAPRDLLAMIPGLELVALPESEICCGAPGGHNLPQTQH